MLDMRKQRISLSYARVNFNQSEKRLLFRKRKLKSHYHWWEELTKRSNFFSSTKWSSFPIRSFTVFPNYDFFPASFDHLRNICASALFMTKSITLPSLSFRRCETTQYTKLKLVLCEVYQSQNEACRAWLLQCAFFQPRTRRSVRTVWRPKFVSV